MNRKRLTIGLTLSCVISLASGRAEAGQLPFKGTLSATASSTEMDINGDGVKNALAVAGAKSTLGSSTVQGPNGEFPPAAVPCPDGQSGFTETPGTGGLVFRFNSTGDLLYERDTSFRVCLDSSTGIFS